MKQFTAKRLVGIGLVSAITIGWMIWMQAENTPFGAPPAPSKDAWSTYWPEAIASIAIVVVLDAVVIALTLRRSRRLKEKGEEL
jgi:uncharacterized iron-regulated membrane protein